MLDAIKFSEFKEMIFNYEKEYAVRELKTQRRICQDYLKSTEYLSNYSEEGKEVNASTTPALDFDEHGKLIDPPNVPFMRGQDNPSFRREPINLAMKKILNKKE